MMKKLFSGSTTLFCFSPHVMLATCIIELVLALYVLIRYKATAFGRVIIFILLLLASFQLIEYQLCGQASTHTLLLAKLGYVAITLLPVMGLYLVALVTKRYTALALGSIACSGYIIYFVFMPYAIQAAVCGGNYMIFDTARQNYWLYGAYYFGFLLLGVWQSYRCSYDVTIQKHHKKALYWLSIGYLTFIVPTIITYMISRKTLDGLASIMCGFAVTLAIILAFQVARYYYKTDTK